VYLEGGGLKGKVLCTPPLSIGSVQSELLTFPHHPTLLRPDFLVVTEDDRYGDVKRELCEKVCGVNHCTRLQ
jgi:hypothetical protein